VPLWNWLINPTIGGKKYPINIAISITANIQILRYLSRNDNRFICVSIIISFLKANYKLLKLLKINEMIVINY